MRWLRWLFAISFKDPAAGGGWSHWLIWMSVASNLLLWLVFTTIPILIVAFVYRHQRPRYFYDRTTAFWFAAFIFTAGGTHLVRALTFAWPFYRLQVGVTFLAAVVAWLTAAIMLPVALKKEVDVVREERHAFANKVHVDELQITTNLMRLERILAEQRQALSELTSSVMLAREEADGGGMP